MSRRKLLLADDSITIQKVVNLTFADEGVDVVAVSDGEAALKRLAAELPDILLADVNMPGPNGYEICEKVRADELTRKIPVILLVGSFEPFDETEAARVGANAYLTKPFQSIKQLVAQVNELIDAANPAPNINSDEPQVEANQSVAPASDTGNWGEIDIADTSAKEPSPPEPRQFDDLGYEINTPPAAPTPADDIDSLYSRSLAEPSGEEELSDVGIDDEMIETSYSAADSNADLTAFDTGSVSDAKVEDSELNHSETQSETTIETNQDAIGIKLGHEQSFTDDPSKFESTIAYDNWKPADMRDEALDREPAVSDTNYADDGISQENVSEGYAPASNNRAYPEQVSNSGAVGEDTIRMEGRFDTRGSATFQFDDTNLLDLSPTEENPVEITSPVHAVEQGSNKQIVTISPELIEMIAQRVVEKLSEKY